MATLKNVAFISEYAIRDCKLMKGCLQCGWYNQGGRRALVLASTKYNPPEMARDLDDDINIAEIWPRLIEALDELDLVLFFKDWRIGIGGKRFATLFNQIPAEKLSFVMCDWQVDASLSRLEALELAHIRRVVVSDRGADSLGEYAMGRLYQHFLETGELLS